MRFRERCAALFFFTILNISLWLTAPLLYEHSNHPAPLVPITGLHGDAWKVRSLHGVSEKHRAQLGKFYDDDRRFFGNGKGNPEPLTSKTLPYKNKVLDKEENEILQNDKLRNIVQKMVRTSEVLRRVDSMNQLLIAADQIKRQVNVSALTFKSVLQVKKKDMGNAWRMQSYGRRVQLTRSEKLALMSAVPHIKQEAKANKAKKESPEEFVLTSKEDTAEVLSNLTRTWYAFYSQVSRYSMYQEGPLLHKVLNQLAQLPVIKFSLARGEMRLRPELVLAGGAKARFSPLMSSRTQETIPNHLPRDDVHRHTAEIAAFHLDRALGFKRASPCIGRTFSLSKDLIPTSHKLFQQHNVYTSLAGNLCIHGPTCHKCPPLEAGHACGKPDMLEGSMVLDISILNVRAPPTWTKEHPYVHDSDIQKKTPLTHPQQHTSLPYPWARAQRLNQHEAWNRADFCANIRFIDPFYRGRRLLDLVDLAVFDFLQGNMDRTVYEVFHTFHNDSFILHNNNSRGFGQAYHDEITILAPLYQCCLIRYSTFQTLLGFELGPDHLSEVMTESLSHDPLAPILLDQYLLALDRRVSITLKLVYECINASTSTNVLIDDGL